MNVPVNYVAVLLAAVASMVVGFVYYSPVVLGKPWMKMMGITDMKPKGADMAKLYGTSFCSGSCHFWQWNWFSLTFK